MAVQDPRRLYSLWGLMIWGDFGPLTMYRSKRGKIVTFAKTYPGKPPSHLQLEQRAAFAAAAQAWRTLTPAQRDQWELASRRASLCMHGYDLWIHYQLTADTSAIETLQRQTDTNLLPP